MDDKNKLEQRVKTLTYLFALIVAMSFVAAIVALVTRLIIWLFA